MTQPAPTLLAIASAGLADRFGLEGGEVLIFDEALSIRVAGLHFFQRFDFTEPDPFVLACSIDSQVSAFARRVRRKAQRTPRCYFPREENE